MRSDRPDGTVTIAMLQAKVHDRLHAASGDDRLPTHPPAACHSFNLATVVTETLTLMAEWEFVDLDFNPELRS